jgi:hypothetical protein
MVTGLGSPLWTKLAADLGIEPSTYHSVPTPTRVMNTRDGTGAGVPVGAVAGQGTVTLSLPADVPGTATSVVLNTTVTGTAADGYITVYPGRGARPTASNLNFTAGATLANLVTVQMHADKRVSFYNSSQRSVQLIADLAGYYTPDDSGQTYTPISPTRVLDTRNGTGGAAAPVPARSARILTLTGGLATSDAVVLNVTATRGTDDGFLTVYPADGSRPVASNLNYGAGRSVPNLAVVRVPADGTVAIYNGSDGSVDVVVDAEGAFGSAGSAFHPQPPLRILAPRKGTGGLGSSPLGADATAVFTLPASIPTGVTAVLVNVTVVGPTRAGYLTVYPGSETRPNASNLNFRAGQTVPNLVAVGVGAARTIAFTNASAGGTHVVADLAGYYAP